MARYIKKMRVVEVALVDHPAVPGAKFLLFKAADGGPGEAGDESEVKKSKARELLDSVVKTLKRIGEFLVEDEQQKIIDVLTKEKTMDDEARIKAIEDGLEAIRKTLEERADGAEKKEVKKEEKADKEEKPKEENPLQEAVKELKAQDGEFIKGFDKLGKELKEINARLDKAVSKSSVPANGDDKKKEPSIFAGRFD